MTVQVQYASANVPHVRPHVQAWADAADKRAQVQHFGTYNGHEPTPDRALDCFPASRAEGDKLAAWAIQPEVMEFYGIDYVIWYQRIYNPEIATHWRDMADRGSNTANHKDHVHVSFLETAPAISEGPQPQPQPQPSQEDDFMKQFIIHGNGGAFISDLLTFKVGIATPADLEVLRKGGIPEIPGDLSKAMLGRIPDQKVAGAD